MEQQGIMRQLPTDDQTIVDYLYRIAGEYGEKAAVLMGDAALSYHDLNARSNQLAHYLRGLGIGEDRVVAIRLPRGMAMLIAIFAIVKAGGAYLPLAYNAPRSRIENILSNSGAVCLIGTDDGDRFTDSSRRNRQRGGQCHANDGSALPTTCAATGVYYLHLRFHRCP